MTDSIRLPSREELENVLSLFDSGTRSRGESCFRAGEVVRVECVNPEESFRAELSGEEPIEVHIERDVDGGWLSECTCVQKYRCWHIYAAMKGLLAEDNLSRVRDLSATPTARNSGRQDRVLPQRPLSERLRQALGRPLKKKENDYLERIGRLYRRTRLSRALTGLQLQDLGFVKSQWDRVERLWPNIPETELEFWQYLVAYARRTDQAIPQFMEPLSDTSAIDSRLGQWLRRQSIRDWQSVFENWRSWDESGPVSVPCWELRLWFTDSEAILECRHDDEEFKPLKLETAFEVLMELSEGEIRLTPPSALLWSIVRSRVAQQHDTVFSYDDSAARRMLRVVIAEGELVDRTVDESGHPIRRRDEVLAWRLEPADEAARDYRFYLALPDGTRHGGVIAKFEGHPTYYLCTEGLFRGPACSPDSRITEDNLVPAPAIESAAGVRMLESARVELPESIGRRVIRVPMRVLIRCELAPLYRGSSTENCEFTVAAESGDGNTREHWTMSRWSQWPDWSEPFPENRPPQPEPRASDAIVVYDRDPMKNIADLMAPLPLKAGRFPVSGVMRVTRKFPEIFSEWLQSLPASIDLQLRGDLATLANAPVAGNVRLEVEEKSIDWFDLSVVLDVADTKLSRSELKLLLRAKGKWVRLDQKGWRRLQFNVSSEEDEQLSRLGLSARELSDEPQRLHALQLADPAAKKFLSEPQAERVQRRANEIKTRVHPEIPAAIRADLRAYQRDGFHFLAYLSANGFGGVLADDMGLGKTLQTLTWIVWLREGGHRGGESEKGRAVGRLPSLVVCPKSVMDNWRAEIERFVPGLRVRVWAPGELEEFIHRLDSADLHVINYNQVRSLGESLVPVQWLAVVLDEGQYIKNPNSQTAQVVRQLNADQRLVLTGTPIENRLLDLWSLMAFAMPGVLGSRSQFGKQFARDDDPFARQRLASRVRPFLLRRTKSQVASDLPDRVEEDLYCSIEGEQLKLYRAELKRAQQLLLNVATQKQLAELRFHFLTSLLRLRQICCHPRLVVADSKGSSAKMDALMEQLEPLMSEGQKVLVFSQFVEMLKLLRGAVRSRGWNEFYLAGETENRGKLVEQFQAADGAGVFLISLKAGGFGLNLTAASYVFLFDPWWNPAVENQAIDRTHRIGQVNKVNAYRLLIKDSIEEKIRVLQKNKSMMAEDVLGEERFAQSLTLGDLTYLFAD